MLYLFSAQSRWKVKDNSHANTNSYQAEARALTWNSALCWRNITFCETLFSSLLFYQRLALFPKTSQKKRKTTDYGTNHLRSPSRKAHGEIYHNSDYRFNLFCISADFVTVSFSGIKNRRARTHLHCLIYKAIRSFESFSGFNWEILAAQGERGNVWGSVVTSRDGSWLLYQ